MEAKRGVVLDNNHRIFVDLKEKQTSQHAGHLVGARQVLPQGSQQPILISSLHKLGKRKRSDGYSTKCRLGSKESFLKNYLNFMNSGPPQRFMFLEKGKWKDFPEAVVQLAREHFHLKNAVIKVEFDGCELLLDILYMIQLDVKTGVQRPIAWVDEAGCAFFPKDDYGDGGMSDCSGPELGNDLAVLFEQPNGACDIKVELDIEITGVNNCSKLEECVEESNAQAKRIRIEQNPVRNIEDSETRNKCGEKTDAYVEQIQEISKRMTTEPVVMHDIVDSNTVRNMFIKGTDSSISVNILEVKRCSGDLFQARLELFQKQIEITTNYRGDPNVKYAWLPVTKEALSGILTYGVGYLGPKIMSAYGTGVNLAPVNCAHISASYYDDDENGVRYVVLCRVIMGNVELVHPGSKQCHPSTEDFDSGVDDLQNPSCFIVWNMNMNSHIFPEYAISFNTSPCAEGDVVREQGRIDLSGVTTSQGHQDQQLQFDCSPAESGKGCQPFALAEKRSREAAINNVMCASKTPRSPWLPFPLLLEAISKEVAANSMHLVNVHYNLFRSKKISRDEFVIKLRSIVGDTLLRTTILSLQHKMPPKSTVALKVPKQEQEC